MIARALVLPPTGAETFFLWGPRQVGKTTLLRHHYPDSRWIDLLKNDEFRLYATRPERLRQELEGMPHASRKQIVIDEVQKVPALLPEVHWLIENRGLRFALCGSSARKVRRGAANLLGGRAVRYELRGLTAGELGGAAGWLTSAAGEANRAAGELSQAAGERWGDSGSDHRGKPFSLDKLLNVGYLPHVQTASRPRQLLNSYIADYIREEIAAEGLVRNLPAFSDFLDAAALSDTEPVNFSNVARECGVSGHTVRDYFGILEDTLLGSWLPAWRKRRKRRLIRASKFYFSDVGVVNRLARRGSVVRGSELYGKAFENWVHHELSAYVAYTGLDEVDGYEGGLTYWRLPSGIEVDFILGDMRVAVEAKATRTVASHHMRGLRTLADEHGPGDRGGPEGRDEPMRRMVVSLEPRARRTSDGIWVLPAEEFARRLWAGEVVA